MRASSVLVLSLLALPLAGCRVDRHGDGNKQDVKIATPFGGMSVQTDDANVLGAIGLDGYPGAVLDDKSGKDNGAANVNLNFGSFHLGVKAVSYTTPDTPDKVLAFYRHAMARYGTVILCKGSAPVGTPTTTPDGLTCKDDHNGENVHLDESGRRGELKAGSRQHQHIVAVDERGSGSKFSLLALDLPAGLEHRDSNSDDKQ